MGVSRGGYYAWLNGAENTRRRRDRELVKAIGKIQEKKRFRYGTPRMTDALQKRGYRVGHNRVAGLMAENALQASRLRKYRVTTMSKHNHPASPNRYSFTQSMSRKGNCWDNAVVESFFSTLKSELIQGYRYPTRQEAKDEIFEYIEVFYNRERSHSYLGYETPVFYGSHAA